MDTISQNRQNLQSLLTQGASVGVIASEKQNIDILSAALSLHFVLQDSGYSSQVISKKDPIVEHSFLVGIDQLKKSFGGITKSLVVSFPYVEGEIEKVSYNIEGDRLNVNLFGTDQGIKFEEKDVKYVRQGSSPQIVITVGVQNISEIEDLIDSASTKIINIDNNVGNALFGDIVLVDAQYSSLSEVVARMSIDLGLQIEFDVAQNLLDGISFATSNFSSQKTSPLAFEMAGVLMQKGAVRKDMKAGRSQSADTSLSMLNNQAPKPFGNTQQPFSPSQNLPKQPAPAQRQSQLVEPPIRASFDENAQSLPVDNSQMQQDNLNGAAIPTEDEAPSDWFMPKVFKSNKSQE